MGFSLFYHARSPNLHVTFHHPVVYVCTVSKNEKKINIFLNFEIEIHMNFCNHSGKVISKLGLVFNGFSSFCGYRGHSELVSIVTERKKFVKYES